MKKSGRRRRAGTSEAATTEPRRARRREHDVDVAERRGHVVERRSASRRTARELAARAPRCGSRRTRSTAPREERFAGRELAHAAGADEQHAPASKVAEDLLRQRGRGRRHRRGALADRGLRPDALADLQRLAEDAVEQRPRRGGVVRRPDLAEDLALAGNERVEPGGDAEEVDGRGLVVQAVDDRVERLAGELLERRRRPGRGSSRRGRARSGSRSRDRRRRRERGRARRRARASAPRAPAARRARRGARCRRARASRVAPGEREPDEDHEHEAERARRTRRGGRSAAPRGSRRRRARSHRDAHQRVEAAALLVQADEPGDEAERQQRQRDGDGPRT